ncbi:zinc-ribbon domain-containing protein [Clostridium sp. AM48-13]|uniref:zinc-ribbon domain-containing protein n=1 Tax=Clostridium sp. AM48-13 TaxID=2293034 RepID=UPI001FAB19B0
MIWRCEKGHEWEAAVKSRTINRTGCPYCSHNKVLAGFNDLATLLPDIMIWRQQTVSFSVNGIMNRIN